MNGVLRERVPDLFYPRGLFRSRVLLNMIQSRWLVRWRWIIVFSCTVVLAAEAASQGGYRRPWAVLYCVGALGLANAVWTLVHLRLASAWGSNLHPPASVLRRVVWFTNAQMCVDLVLLTVLLRYTGGIENPIVIFYLFHVLLAAELLRLANAIVQGLLALGLYAVVVCGECTGLITPHYPFLPCLSGVSMYRETGIVVAGVAVLAIAITGCLLTMWRIAARLDEQERELQRAHTALVRGRESIERMQAQRARFMLTSAHQLKSPLAGIETLAGLVRDGVVTGDQVRGINERIVERCRNGIAQVAELLTLARVEQGNENRHRSSAADVRAALEAVLARYADEAASKGVELVVGPTDPGDLKVAVVENDLGDCLSNLVENAVKYTGSGGRVEIQIELVDDWVRVRVRDNGIGIAEETVDELFDPFRRGQTALSAGVAGSGLGLAIVKEVVTQARGRIEVHSAVGEGSEFVVSFPRASARTVSD